MRIFTIIYYIWHHLRILEEKTEVIYGAENIINKTLQALSRCKSQVDNCVDPSGLSIFVIPNHPITKTFQELKRRGIRLRLIAEITKDNIPYRRDLMKTFELQHLDKVKGNFGVADCKWRKAIPAKQRMKEIEDTDTC
jgi:hypothetical protein